MVFYQNLQEVGQRISGVSVGMEKNLNLTFENGLLKVKRWEGVLSKDELKALKVVL